MSSVERIALGDDGFTISRLVTGLWQIADMEKDGVEVDLNAAAVAMREYAEAGLDTFDMADHYGSAELIAGQFLAQHADGLSPRVFTKWCPKPGPMSMDVVESAIDLSLDRLGVSCIDLLQFHWWQYEHPAYLDALRNLDVLRQRGKIRHLALTNFDTAHLRVVLSCGIKIVSNQICYSCIDMRASGEMAQLCEQYGVKLICFGVLAGGFLSDKYVDMVEPPADDITDWSRMKYRRFFDLIGGWNKLQAVLNALRTVGKKHGATVANVAARFIMQQPAVGAVIVGARLGKSSHIAENSRMFDFRLDSDDVLLISTAVSALNPVPGDCGDEYRKPPFLTATGDLSDHLETLPQVFTASPTPRGAQISSGTTWETIAGFSRAVRRGPHIHVSGTTATHSDGTTVAPNDAGAQTTYAIDKCVAAIVALGGKIEDVTRTRLYVPRLQKDWEDVARAHGRAFAARGERGDVDVAPANTLVSAELVGDDYLVEVEVEAFVPDLAVTTSAAL